VAQYTVSKLAQLIGTSPDTLRYYERIGLLPEADRSPAGYRLYGEDAIARVRFIKGAQHVGLRLEEIGELIAIFDQGMCPCGHTRRLLEDKLVHVEAEIASLNELRGEIRRMLDEQLPAVAGDGCGTSFIELRKGGVK
jgi:DNA-binding transcriptional MerR regulator